MLAQTRQATHPAQFAGYTSHAANPAKPEAAKERGFAKSLELIGLKLPFARNEEVYGQDEPAEYLYKVISGSVRTNKLMDDGRRQVGAFYLPGDIFGLESGSTHRFSAEAMAETVLLAVKRSTLVALAQTDTTVARELWQITARELDHVHDQMMLLGRSSAQERVVSFLAEMADRSANHSEFDLPMSRQDIADYLGLTIETVSRTFSSLERKQVIELPSSRKVRLKSRAALVRSLHS